MTMLWQVAEQIVNVRQDENNQTEVARLQFRSGPVNAALVYLHVTDNDGHEAVFQFNKNGDFVRMVNADQPPEGGTA